MALLPWHKVQYTQGLPRVTAAQPAVVPSKCATLPVNRSRTEDIQFDAAGQAGAGLFSMCNAVLS